MFSPEDISARIRGPAFVPVRIVTSTGQTYDIYHPELIMVGRRGLIIGTASAENPAHFDQVTRVTLLHVTELRDLPTLVPPASSDGTA